MERLESKLCRQYSIDLPRLKEFLWICYENANMHQGEIAEYLSVSRDALEKLFKRLGLQARGGNRSPRKYAHLSGDQRESLDGLMLGDGHLAASTCAAQMTFGFKHRQTCEAIVEEFSQLTHAPFHFYENGGWFFSFHSYIDLLPERRRWYPNGLKIVPTDLELTVRCCYWWYIGDGCRGDSNLTLCTNGFKPEDKEVLISKLQALGFTARPRKNGEIAMSSISSNDFVDWLSLNMEVQKEYLYKFRKGTRKHPICQREH